MKQYIRVWENMSGLNHSHEHIELGFGSGYFLHQLKGC